MDKIAVLGTEYHGKLVAEKLAKQGLKADYMAAFSVRNYFHFLVNLFLFRYNTYFFVYAPSKTKHILLLFIPLVLFRRKIFIEWIGTDVLDITTFPILRRVINNFSTNLCECDWISDELKRQGVIAKIGPYISFSTLFDQNIGLEARSDFLKREKVFMTYSSSGRDDFYGINELIDFFSSRSELKLIVVGSSGDSNTSYPSNIKFLGRIAREDVLTLYATVTGFIRIPYHDGLSYSVLEALWHAVPVAYNKNLVGCHYVASKHDIEKFVSDACSNPVNYSGRQYVYDNFYSSQVAESNLNKMFSTYE